MKGKIYIDNIEIGHAIFNVTDASMGGISGELIPNENYNSYRERIQNLTISKGIANNEDFELRIVINDELEINPCGGIGITDLEEFDEIIIESAGIENQVIEKIKNAL